jgi:hypothetical protein
MRNVMRVVLGMLAVSILSASSCINQRFVDGVDKGYGPIYKDYVDLLEKKSGYDTDTIRIRKQAADELKALIDEAKKE